MLIYNLQCSFFGKRFIREECRTNCFGLLSNNNKDLGHANMNKRPIKLLKQEFIHTMLNISKLQDYLKIQGSMYTLFFYKKLAIRNEYWKK